jgi:flagellar motor component MotA
MGKTLPYQAPVQPGGHAESLFQPESILIITGTSTGLGA